MSRGTYRRERREQREAKAEQRRGRQQFDAGDPFDQGVLDGLARRRQQQRDDYHADRFEYAERLWR